MKNITIQISEKEYKSLVDLLSKIEHAMHPPRKRYSKWKKEDGYVINTKTGKKLNVTTNKFE